MSKTYTITDHITGTEYQSIDRYDIADTLTGLFPEAPADVTKAIDSLTGKLLAGSYYGDEETYLQVSVEVDQ